MAVAVVAGMTPLEILARDGKSPYYPPLWQNLVGSDDDSYFFAHALRDGEQYDLPKSPYKSIMMSLLSGLGSVGLVQPAYFTISTKAQKA